MKLPSLVDAALLDQERRILQALPQDLIRHVKRFKPCARCEAPMPANAPSRQCKPCRETGNVTVLRTPDETHPE